MLVVIVIECVIVSVRLLNKRPYPFFIAGLAAYCATSAMPRTASPHLQASLSEIEAQCGSELHRATALQKLVAH